VKKTRTSADRLRYLDWLRGIGAVIMLQGHVFDSLLRNDLRAGGPFVLSQFVGGMPPAIFLFLTGVTLGFLMDSTERKGFTPGERVFTAFRRSGYLFLLAFAFRLQLWLFSQPAPWTDLFRVDILNCMGLAIALMSPMAFFRTVERVRFCAVVGFAIAALSPIVSQIDASRVPWVLRNYLVPDYRFFAFFPWGAYLAFGVSAGSLIRITPHESIDRIMQWLAIIGGGLILACQYFSNIPYTIYAKSEYWLNSPAQILSKLGVTLLIMAVAYLWTRNTGRDTWSWVRQLGTTSLLVYWIHIELIYGHWLWFWKGNLNVPQTILTAFCLIVLMVVLSAARTYYRRIGAAIAQVGWWASPKPERVPGD
jgi:uncharacterized membrane protein